MVDDVLEPALDESRIKSIEDELALQVRCYGPIDDPTTEGIEHHGEHYGKIEKVCPGRYVCEILSANC